MSTYAQFDDDGDQRQIASNLGWSEFGDWCDGLDHEKHPLLVQLWEHGQSNDVKALMIELTDAMEREQPSPDVKGSAELLLDALNANRGSESVYVTN